MSHFFLLIIPDFNSVSNPISMRSTHFNTFNDLVGSDTTVKQDIQNKVLSSSLLDVQINVDYTKRADIIDPAVNDFWFGNFVMFGSAEKRSWCSMTSPSSCITTSSGMIMTVMMTLTLLMMMTSVMTRTTR